MIAIHKTACLVCTTFFVKLAHVVAQPMLAPVAWGLSTHGGDITENNSEDITGMVKVSCGREACAGLKTDGSAIAWGNNSHGANTVGKDVSSMAQVLCIAKACAGLKIDGSVIAWGDTADGGGTQGKDLTGMTQIVCGNYACAGMKADGLVIGWGNGVYGGDTTGLDLSGMAQVTCGGHACAGLKTDGSIVTWGHNSYGGDAQGNDVTGMAQVVCGGHACIGLKPDGSIVAWGESSLGGNTQGNDVTGIAQVVCGNNACAGLKTDGSVIAWGDSANGGDTQSEDVTGIVQVACGGFACAGLKTDGSIVAWGDSANGGDTQGEDVTGVIKVVCGGHACAGLKTDGSVVAWGDSAKGGDTQGKLITGANQITCGINACVAWYDLDTAGGGGDPHFMGFGDIYFTWQGHCDLVLVKSTNNIDVDTDFEVHIRTTRVRKWSKIDAIAIKVGQDVGVISSANGKLILNGHEVDEVQQKSLTVAKSNTKRNIVVYVFTIDGDKNLEITVNLRTEMIYTTLSGNYPRNTEGILGSPYQPGFISRNGEYILDTNVNIFVETWQVTDSDSHLFHINRAPQYPSKCVYNIDKKASRRKNRHLKQLHYITKDEATNICSNHHPGPLQKFCVEDVVMTGDLDSAKDGFYE